MSYHAGESSGSHSDSKDTRMSQLEQPAELSNGEEPRRCMREAEWKMWLKENPDIDRKWPSIFRVPSVLKKESKEAEAYIPKIVSLGPYHHRSAKLSPMESHKGRAVHRMMTRASDYTFFPDRAKEAILLLEDEIIDSYEEKIDFHRETVARMLSSDGCFLLEILRTLNRDILPGEMSRMPNGYYYEPLFHRDKILYIGFDILCDILKLENQVPFIVLRKLIELEVEWVDDVDNKLLDVLKALLAIYPFKCKIDLKQWSWQQPVHHLLDFLHTLIVSPPSDNSEAAEDAGMPGCMGACTEYMRPRMGDCMGCRDEGFRILPNGEDDVETIPRAVELRKAGIKFKSCAGGIKGICFDPKSATIYLPPIIVVDSTEILFRNLIAFEMCKPSQPNYVVCYIYLMDLLVDKEEDVALLREMGILSNSLGSDLQVAELFNGLCKGATGSLRDVFRQLTQKVNLYHKNRCKVYSAELLSVYCSSPWKILGLVGGIVLLLLTVVQTIFTILSVIK